MIQVLMVVSIMVSVTSLYTLYIFKKICLKSVLKILGVSLLLIYAVRLYHRDAIDASFNLLAVDIDTNIHAPLTWILPVWSSVGMIMLRWGTVVMITWMVVGNFFNQKLIYYMIAILGILFGILNIIFYQTNMIATLGLVQDQPYVQRMRTQFAIETIVFSMIAWLQLLSIVKAKAWPKIKQIGSMLIIFVISAFAVLPQGILANLFGYYGDEPLDYTPSHIFLIVLPFLLMPVIYLAMRKKKQEDINLMFVFLVFASAFQFFYIPRSGLQGWPLHLCNTAVILMVIAFVFKNKGFFYFTYFANVIGALAATVFPNYSQDLFHINILHFVYNHTYALIIPIMAVGLKVFPRPNLKNMFQAIGVFTIYFLVVVFVNTWFRNYPTGVNSDYFFTYSDHISSMFGGSRAHFNNFVAFEYQGLTFTFFYLFQPIFYISFVFLMFMNWYIYDNFFLLFEKHAVLREKHRMIRMDMLQLKKALQGRSIREPINPGGVDMIKITNFSKRYGNSKIKAVDNFSLEVHKGEVFGFLGHNGAGKSTTIKSLVGIQSITEGEMEICGYSIKTQPLMAKLHMGYVSDNHAVYEKLTGREYINYVADLYQVTQEDRDEKLNEFLKRFTLEHAIDQEIKSYSHGMKQKLVVIASLIHDPDVWILDEPLTGLDPTSAFQIKEMMRDHADRGHIVFFSSHVIEVVERICNRIAIINKGKLTGVYEIEDLKREGIALETLYMSTDPVETT